MRGEHQPRTARARIRRGSSPHARGAPDVAVEHQPRPGIIPACAGSTIGGWRNRKRPRDHPRMRGEHRAQAVLHVRSAGSSPHARGAPQRTSGRQGRRGIIPACAGSTSRSPAPCSRSGDHPRMRGEHILAGWRLVVHGGSSPHARGAPDIAYLRFANEGIIPACAGSTVTASEFFAEAWDHPRMRGEHVYFPRHVPLPLGSSPHARGALCVRCRHAGARGIIPACAGSTG